MPQVQLVPIPDDPLEFQEYQQSQMPTAEELATAAAALVADKAAADKSVADKGTLDGAAIDTVSKEYAARLRNEAETSRLRVKELEAQNADRERAQLEKDKEFEKIAAHEKALRVKAEADSAEIVQRMTQTQRRDRLEALAARHGLLDADDVDKLDQSKIDWQDGKPVGAEAAFDDLKARKPHYFKVEGDLPTPKPGMPAPRPSTDPTPGKDIYALTDAEFDAQYKQLGRTARA